MKKLHLLNIRPLNTILLFLAVMCFVSCQPPGDDFVPLPMDGTTVEPLYDKENVIQIYDDEQIQLKMYGQWRPYGGGFWMTLNITNKSSKSLEIDSGKFDITSTFDKKIESDKKRMTIEGGKSETMAIAFGMPEMKGEYKPQKFYVGNTLNIDLPVSFGKERQERIYKFAFKYDYYQQRNSSIIQTRLYEKAFVD